MDYLNLINEWLASHSSMLIGIGGLSILILMFSIIGLGWFISQIPEDYFIHEKRQAKNWDQYSPETRVMMIIVRRPMTSESAARNIAPNIIPAREKLNTSPSISSLSCISSPIWCAVTAMAVMSKPSTMLKTRQSETIRICRNENFP